MWGKTLVSTVLILAASTTVAWATGLDIDRVLEKAHPDSSELASAIEKAQRVVVVNEKAIERIRQEPDTQAPVPSAYWNNTKKYKTIAENRCNKSIVDEQHIAIEPAETLGLRLFQSECYTALSDSEKDALRKCPDVYRYTGSKAYRLDDFQGRTIDLKRKIELTKRLLAKLQAERIEAEGKDPKRVGAPDHTEYGTEHSAHRDGGQTPVGP